jgi:hypothetical protein
MWEGDREEMVEGCINVDIIRNAEKIEVIRGVENDSLR